MNQVIHGDCLEVMATFPDKYIDLLLTDPPYGVNVNYDSYDDTESNWYKLMHIAIPEMIRVSKMVIMPSCQIKRLAWIYKNYPPDWLMCWYKGSPGHASYIGFNDWEPHLVYGRRKTQLYMHDYFQTKSSPKMGSFDHPCPKPIDWADWIIKRVARDDKILICDPFVGSGTVVLSAIKNGHNYIGIDISEEYCETARKRISEHEQQLALC